MQNSRSKFKIDSISTNDLVSLSPVVDSGSDIDFLRDFRNQSKRSFRFFAGASALFLLVALLPSFFEQGASESKKILGAATTGFDLLQGGKYENAAQNFEEARKSLNESGAIFVQALNYFPVGEDLRSALDAGTLVSSAASDLTKGFQEFQDSPFQWDAIQNQSRSDFYQNLKKIHELMVKGSVELRQAETLAESVNPNVLPPDYRVKFQQAGAELGSASAAVDELQGMLGVLLGLLGGEKKTYVLIFQNNDEIRATGGFIGTYGIVEFENGQARIARIESVYALDGQLREAIAAPGPLRRQVTQNWAMRDSNWFADFPTSARKILEFFEKESGILADGVIAVTPDLFENLLSLTGPIALPEYGETLTADNFRQVAQYKTSQDYDRVLNQPKKFLSDFAPLLLFKLGGLPGRGRLSVMSVLREALREKQLMAFSLDQSLEEQFKKFGADGGLKATDGDYLAVVHSNVGGGKTDQSITQKVEKRVSFDSGGLAIVRLKVVRSNLDEDEFFFPRNIDFMRIFVPRQAKLLSAAGFDEYEVLPSAHAEAKTDDDLQSWDANLKFDSQSGIYTGQEGGYNFFAGFQELSPGETKTLELVYEVQFGSAGGYTQLLQKQPGAKPFDFSLEVNYLPGNISYVYPENFTLSGNRAYMIEQVKTDKVYWVIGQ